MGTGDKDDASGANEAGSSRSQGLVDGSVTLIARVALALSAAGADAFAIAGFGGRGGTVAVPPSLPASVAGSASSARAITAAIAIAGAVTSPEPGAVAVGAGAVLGIVAHAVSVCIHKRATALGGPVTGGLRGPCGTAAQRIACAFQPCGTCTGPWAIYLGVIAATRAIAAIPAR